LRADFVSPYLDSCSFCLLVIEGNNYIHIGPMHIAFCYTKKRLQRKQHT
jgi:hypothetical protein